MNEDFNLDGNHEVDDLFRDALGNYSESPSDAAWSRLNTKLNFKEVHDFVTFKKPPAKSPSWPTPVYRMQWFRGMVAAVVGAALITTVTLLITGLNQKPATDRPNLADSNVVPSASQNTPATDQNVMPAHDNTAEALTNQPQSGNGVQKVVTPGVTAPGSLQVNDQPVHSDIIPDTRIENETGNQPVVSEKDLPLLVLQPAKDLQKKYDRRSHEFYKVDSLINAMSIQDSLQQIAEEDNPVVSNEDAGQVDAYIPVQPNVSGDDISPVVANSFTPNGDGLNEYFYIHNLEKYPDNVLLVQDRKGRVVLDKKNYTGDWNAVGVPDGTYFYLFTYKNEQGQEMSIQGVVYIIR